MAKAKNGKKSTKRQRQKIDKTATATAKMAKVEKWRVLSWNKFFKIPNKNVGTYGRFCMKSCNKNLRNSEIQ